MILSTTPQIEGHTIREYKGIVTGETIIGANMFKDLFAGIRDIVGGRAGSYEKVLAEAKDTSMQEMMQRAQALGANAIVGIDIDYETVQRNGCSHLNRMSCGSSLAASGYGSPTSSTASFSASRLSASPSERCTSGWQSRIK